MKLEMIFPFLSWFKLVTKESIKADFFAGLTGAVIVLPQGIAFATIAGLPPEYGLYTAMVTPIIAALFGSSRHLVSGPTTAISIVVFSAISHHAEPGTTEFVMLALTLTFLAGVYQLGFGLARLGSLVNFVSHTVVIGFTAGAAILIATSQMKHITAITVPKGESFLHTWADLYQGLSDINGFVLSIAVGTLLIAIVAKKIMPKSPYLLVGMIVGSVMALFLKDYNDGIKLVGEIPAHLPPLSSPDFSLETIRMLAPEAFAVALLGLIEAVSISRAVATKSNQRIDPNQEFMPTVDQELKMLYKHIVFSSPPGTMDKFIDNDEKTINIIVYCRDKTTETIQIVMDRIHDYIRNKSPFGKRSTDVKREGFDKFVYWIDGFFREQT